MDTVSWFLKIPPDPRSPGRSSGMRSTNTVSRFSSLFLRSSVRRSGPNKTPQEKASKTVTWCAHIEVAQIPPRSVSWSTHVEVFVIAAREGASNDCDQRLESTAGGSEKDDNIDPHCVVSVKGLHRPTVRARQRPSSRVDR